MNGKQCINKAAATAVVAMIVASSLGGMDYRLYNVVPMYIGHEAQLPVQPPFLFFLSLTSENTAMATKAVMAAIAMIVTAFSAIHANMISYSFPSYN